jgi:hypothetical protein
MQAVTVGKVPRFRGFSKPPQNMYLAAPIPVAAARGFFCIECGSSDWDFFYLHALAVVVGYRAKNPADEKRTSCDLFCKGPHCVRCAGLHGPEGGKESRRHSEG